MIAGAYLALLGTFFVATDSAADPSTDVALFVISKSENRNQIQYVVHVDAQCSPVAPSPVDAYWRMLEEGPGRTAPLLPRERPAYGLSSQSIVPPVTAGATGAVRVVLAAVADRAVLVETWRANDGQCRAFATARIANAPARLVDVYVRLKLPLWVDYVLLRGWSIDGTHRVEEKLVRGAS
ncbi:MAG TPA: DUF4833 domain-containing protein [Polyangiaceae bacterium]|jgi:hypothetical protein